MSKLPTPEIIKQVTDPKQLQDACLSLLRIVEKERDSKQKYRSSATLLKQELDAVKMELRCVEEKNESLVECIKNSKDIENNSKSEQNFDESQKLKEDEILRLQQIISNSESKISELTNKNQSLEKAQTFFQSQLKEKEQKNFELESKLNETKKKFDDISIEHQKLISKLQASDEKSNKLLEQLNQLNSTSVDQEQLNQMIQENTKLTDKLKEIEINQNSLISVNENYKNQIKELEETNRQLKEQIDQLSTQSKLNEITIKTAQFDHQAEFNRIQSENDVLKEQNEKLNKELLEIKEKLENSEKLINQLNADHQTLLNITENNKIVAKERIKKLKTANIELEESKNAEIEQIKNEFQVKIDELQKQIQIETETKEKVSEETKQTVTKLKTQKKNLKQKINEMKTENDELKSKIAELEVSIHDLTSQNQIMISELSSIHSNEDETEKVKSTNAALNNIIQKMNIEIIQLKEQIQNNENVQLAVADKEATISKLKMQIQNFIKVDKEKSEKLEKMQEEIFQLTEKVGLLSSSQNNFNAVDQLAIVEREKEDLQKRLDNSEATNEMKKKNQKLAEMIEKSNNLYISVKEENNLLKSQIEQYQKKNVSLSYHSNIVCTVDPHLSTQTSSLASNEQDAINERKKNHAERKLAQTAYLRRVLLQFFTEDEKNRIPLISIILKLVGCTDEQISAAIRQWERNSHLISGLFGF